MFFFSNKKQLLNFFLFNSHRMESTWLWDIKGSEGYIYAFIKWRYFRKQEVKPTPSQWNGVWF